VPQGIRAPEAALPAVPRVPGLRYIPGVDRLTVELSALGFQSLLTVILAIVYYRLWETQHRAYFLSWAAAWAVYALKLGCISAWTVGGDIHWLFADQAATGITALLLLWAALQFSHGLAWRRHFVWFPALTTAWALGSIYGIREPRISALTNALLLAAVTLWTGVVFWRRRRDAPSAGATLLAWTFTLWGVQHFGDPLLRSSGTGMLWGVFADVLFVVAASIGTLFLVLGEGRRALEARTAQLEELTRLLLRAQEDERRRIARELHDEAGQVLTAVKIELDLEGRREAAEMVGRALGQVRDLSNLLRPAVLDDFGLVPAVRGLVEDFSKRTRVAADLAIPEGLRGFTSEQEVVIYRVVQEALTNVARHAEATRVRVDLAAEDRRVRLVVQDDGRGVIGEAEPHLGLLGMRERVTAVGGSLEVRSEPGRGFRIEAMIPLGAAV
jgi:signal transduction histidine kinase